MGTDIHLAAEVRVDGQWRYQKSFLGYNDDGFEWDDDPGGRFYFLFAVLAGVRNGFGFAGVPTHEPVEPLFEARGLPKDIDAEAYGDDEPGPWLGDHSQTWASYGELSAIKWDSYDTIQTGVVPVSIAKDLKPGERPAEWSGSVCGGIGPSEIKTFASLPEWHCSNHPEDRSYIQVSWSCNPIGDCAFRRWLDGPLAKIAEEYGAENVRVLMGFDS